MREQIHTIPISDAMANAGECPFCYIMRRTEEHALNFVLGPGASYMEADIRDMTDREGFCREHFKKMFDYGNALGNAWILKTMTKRRNDAMKKAFKDFKPSSSKGSLFGKKETTANGIVDWIDQLDHSCFVCNMVEKTFQAYMNTFFDLYKKESEFRKQVAESKGFCLTHFKVLCQGADANLKGKDLEAFYEMVLPLMEKNMDRIYEDVSWFVEKFDYKNKDADWKDSKDAVQRTMQKQSGGDPSLPPYKMKK